MGALFAPRKKIDPKKVGFMESSDARVAGMLDPACPVERIPILWNRWTRHHSHVVSMLHAYVIRGREMPEDWHSIADCSLRCSSWRLTGFQLKPEFTPDYRCAQRG